MVQGRYVFLETRQFIVGYVALPLFMWELTMWELTDDRDKKNVIDMSELADL